VHFTFKLGQGNEGLAQVALASTAGWAGAVAEERWGHRGRGHCGLIRHLRLRMLQVLQRRRWHVVGFVLSEELAYNATLVVRDATA
jgi:hypothetical protein